MMNKDFEMIQAVSNDEYRAAAFLFQDYAEWLQVDLGFQSFEEELIHVQEMYGPPTGGIFLVKKSNEYIGCAAIRKIDDTTAELKRMYLHTKARGHGLGQQLLDACIDLAKLQGYQKIRLDTLGRLTEAIALYKKNGFVEIPAYYHNPLDGTVYMELKFG